MRLILALLLFTFPAYASSYDTAAAVMVEVIEGHRYVNYPAKDFVPMKKGERGNCARFAATYVQKLNERGIKTYTLRLRLRSGEGHAIAVTEDGWVLDVRMSSPIALQQFMNDQVLPYKVDVQAE